MLPLLITSLTKLFVSHYVYNFKKRANFRILSGVRKLYHHKSYHKAADQLELPITTIVHNWSILIRLYSYIKINARNNFN